MPPPAAATQPLAGLWTNIYFCGIIDIPYTVLEVVVLMAKIRPQILLAILALGALALYAVNQQYVEIATGCIGGVTALGMRLLEGGDS